MIDRPPDLRKVALLRAMRDLHERASRENAYSCFLDKQPVSLVPNFNSLPSNTDTSNVGLIVNPGFHFQAGEDLPRELVNRALSCRAFLRDYPIVWIEDPGTNIVNPYWARGDWAEVLAAFCPGQPAPSHLAPEMHLTLSQAGILVPRTYQQSRRAEWEKICGDAQIQFQSEKFAIVRNILHPFQLGAMREYCRTLVASGNLPLGDGQVAKRYHRHHEVLANFFHLQLTGLVARVAGEPVKPSYAYFASYTPGADLLRHVDREQCEFSISLLVDYSPEPDGPSGWPLYMESPSNTATIYNADLGIGDALFYRGRELVHYRPPLPGSHSSTSFFLHYVREDFTGRLW